MTRQPWIASARFDGAFILGPALLVTALVLSCRGFFATHPVSPALWALLVIGVDVAHVYSTLYRTYFDPAEFARRRTLYLAAPLLGFTAFACLYSLGSMVFWRVLAYLAVFHFVRQQYGFMMIYGRRERRHPGIYKAGIDKAAIYAATLYPLVWWHTHPRHFSWFIDGDIPSTDLPWLGWGATLAYAAIMAAYIVKEVRLTRESGFNWPRNLLLAGTALSWAVGIMALDSDLAFTAANVVAHGIPYMALIWLYGRSRARVAPARLFAAAPLYSAAFVPLFLAIPVLLAYVEEGVWDGLVWADHPQLFGLFAGLSVIESPAVLTWLVPLLALPQITHYVLDAFIWRVRGTDDLPLRAMLGPS